MIFRHYIVEIFMRGTASTSLRSLSVSLPFRALPTDTKPRSRWRLPWSLDSTMYCRPLRTLNAQRCTVGPHLLEPSRSSSLARAMSPLWLPLVILLVLEDGPSLAATGHHVIDRAGVFDPQWSGHGPRLPHGAHRENRKPALTPRCPLDPGKPARLRASASIFHCAARNPRAIKMESRSSMPPVIKPYNFRSGRELRISVYSLDLACKPP